MSTDRDKPAQEDILAIAVDELRISYDRLDAANDRNRIKILTFIGGGLTTLSFLYAGGDLFIPKEIYGRIFYFVGIGLVFCSLVSLFHALRPRTWSISTEHKDLKRLEYKSKEDFLEYIKEEYLICMVSNMQTYVQRNLFLNSATLPLVVGVMILVVLKSFS